MAKKSSIEKNERRRKLAKKYSGRRTRLKEIARDKSLPMEDRFAADCYRISFALITFPKSARYSLVVDRTISISSFSFG